MSQDWATVDCWFADSLAREDAALVEAQRASDAAGLPTHQVSASQGQLLGLLVRMCGAKSVLEIGTLGGYSTIWLARAAGAAGQVVSVEVDPDRAALARANVVRARLADRVEIFEGPALEVLEELDGPFDFVFIDADKPNNPRYLEHAMRLSRPGTVIVADNVVRGGRVVDESSDDASVQGVRRFVQMVAEEPRLTATAIQTVGSKGWDGFVLAMVES